MPTLELTDDEFATLRDAFDDVGNDCSGVDWARFKALGVKLGFWEAEKPLTEEELKRRQAWANSEHGKRMAELLKIQNEALCKDYAEYNEFFRNPQWSVGSQLRIRLPNDYTLPQQPLNSPEFIEKLNREYNELFYVKDKK